MVDFKYDITTYKVVIYRWIPVMISLRISYKKTTPIISEIVPTSSAPLDQEEGECLDIITDGICS